MNTKILALTILIIASVSAQTPMVYNSTSCAATTARTSAFCLTAQGNNNMSLPVCATVNFTGNVSNRIVTGNVGYYCLPLVLTGNGDIMFNATHNVTVTATTTNNAATWASVAAPATCTKYGDSACATNTCCASRQFTLASSTMNLASQCLMSSMANMTGVASFATNTISLSNITWASNCMAMPAGNGNGSNGNGTGSSGNAALIKYSIGAVASLVALTFF